MRNIRIYQSGQYDVGETISLAKNAVKHIAVVLRMMTGNNLTLFAGDNWEYLSQIININKNKVDVLILKKDKISRESCTAIHLIQTIPKGDKMELIVQKAVELGIT